MSDEPKTSEAVRRAIKKYQSEKTDEIRFRMPKGWKSKIENHAKANGETLTSFLSNLIIDKLGKDNDQEQP